jgi:hypothetical protein
MFGCHIQFVNPAARAAVFNAEESAGESDTDERAIGQGCGENETVAIIRDKFIEHRTNFDGVCREVMFDQLGAEKFDSGGNLVGAER